MPVRFGGASETGGFRDQNEDRWGADPEVGLFIVSDGIGGLPHGEIAAQVAVEVLPPYLRQLWLSDETAATEALLPAAIAKVSDELATQGGSTGATIVAALIADTHCVISHMGDSPALLLHDGRLSQLTTDHTIAQVLVDAGQLTVGEVAEHPGRNKLTRFLGMTPPAKPEVTHFELHPGDRLLMCSDGVSGVLDLDAIQEILGAAGDVNAASEALVTAATEGGSQDNMTALVIEWDDT